MKATPKMGKFPNVTMLLQRNEHQEKPLEHKNSRLVASTSYATTCFNMKLYAANMKNTTNVNITCTATQ